MSPLIVVGPMVGGAGVADGKRPGFVLWTNVVPSVDYDPLPAASDRSARQQTKRTSMNVFAMLEGLVRDEGGHENAGRLGLRGPPGFFGVFSVRFAGSGAARDHSVALGLWGQQTPRKKGSVVPDFLILAPSVAVIVALLAFAVYSENKAQRQRESDRIDSPQSLKRPAVGPAPSGSAGPATRRESPTQPEDSGTRHRLQGDLSKAQQGSPEDKPVLQGHADPSPQHKEPDVVDLAARWNARVFAAAPKTHFMFQPIRHMLPEGIPTWYCPQLVIDGRDARSIYLANTEIELIVLQPVDSDENDPDDRLRTFLLPLSEDTFQVLHVPVSSPEIGCNILTWREARHLLEIGFRSVGRDDLIDYGTELQLLHWSMRWRRRSHDSLYHSIAVRIDDARTAARCASGRVLNHVRKLRPRGAARSKLVLQGTHRSARACLTFYQRYGTVNVEKQIIGRVLCYDEELERPPQWEGVIDVTPEGQVLRVFSPYEPVLRTRARISSRRRL